jgi:hypothetical protein
MKSLQRYYEYGVLIWVAGKLYSLSTIDNTWSVMLIGDRFIPPIEPIPEFGYCLESSFQYPGGLDWYDASVEIHEDYMILFDREMRKVRLSVDHTWEANW